MSKQVKLGTEARKQLVQGIDILADAVVSTLGPNGRNVVIAGGETPQSTNKQLNVLLIKQVMVQPHLLYLLVRWLKMD